MSSFTLLVRAPCVLMGLGFLLHLAGTFSESKSLREAPAWLVRLGWLAQTAGLALRWIEIGDSGLPGLRLPWATPYEATAFLAWAIATTQIWFEANFRSAWTGALTSLGCAMILALAWTTMGGSAQAVLPLSREQASPLFFSQVFLGAFGYAYLFLGACFAAFCFFDRESVTTDSILSGFSFLAALVTGWAFRHYSRLAQPEPLYQALYWALLATGALFASHAFGGFYASRFVSVPKGDEDPRAVEAGWVGEEGELTEAVRRALRWLFVACGAGAVALSGLLVAAHFKLPGFKLRVEAAPFLLIALVALMSGFLLRFMKRRSVLVERLPESIEIDRFSYQAIASGQAILGIQLVVAGFWAYLSRGRYWGWDPTQTYAAIALAATVFYTHGRLARFQSGAKSESDFHGAVALLGLAIAILALAGANLLLPKPLF